MPERVIHKAIGQRVREMRESRGWSLSDLAKRSSISRSYLFQIEQGESIPTQDKIQKLADAFGSLPSELFGESPKEIEMPAGLREFAKEANLGSQEIQMLSQIEYRGQRPSTLEEWRMIYNLIRTVIKKE